MVDVREAEVDPEVKDKESLFNDNWDENEIEKVEEKEGAETVPQEDPLAVETVEQDAAA